MSDRPKTHTKEAETGTMSGSEVPGRVRLDVGRAIADALAEKTEMLDSEGNPMEDFDYVAQVALFAAYPAIKDQVEAEVRERLLDPEVREKARRSIDTRKAIGRWDEALIEAVVEAALTTSPEEGKRGQAR